MKRPVILIPTFNERDNVEAMCAGVLSLGLDVDLLFVDDDSPDGTGAILDRLAASEPRIFVLHRPGKLGVGSAHRDGILWAYGRGYETVITMDCDFTHSPSDIGRLVEASSGHDVTVGSRFLARGSLPGWNPFRKTLTLFGHVLTHRLLGIPFDATGAFRIYRISRIPSRLFSMVTSSGYAFFFESLFLLVRNGFSIGEVSIVLPARTYGHSKLSYREAFRSFRRILDLAAARVRDPGRFVLPATPPDIDPELVDPQGWGDYWKRRESGALTLYSRLASLYRRLVIRPGLSRAIRRHFPAGSRLLHAGCGSGEVDRDLQHEMVLTAVDISPDALALYANNNPGAAAVRHATILSLPFPDGSFDGVYNLGVMEHFVDADVGTILAEFRRILKPGGKVVLFWPHARGTSVAMLGAVHHVLNGVLGRRIRLHPPEVSLLASRSHADGLLRRAGLELAAYSFGPRDGFVQAVVVGRKAS